MPFVLQGSNGIISRDGCTISFIVKHLGIEYVAHIDTEDEHVLKMTWSLILNPSGTPKNVRANSKRKQIALHRMILGVDDSSIFVDHIDGNVLNNKKDNLRLCKQSQNSKNTKLRINSTTGFKGVSYIKNLKKYRAYIVTNYVQKHIGLFGTAKEAAKAYNEAAKKYHGEFAKLNRGVD